jgi:flagellar export protein FliJ
MAPKFSLQSVLDYRHSRVEGIEMELGKLQDTRQQGLAMQAETQLFMNQLYDQLKESQNGDLDLFKIQHLRSDILGTQERLAQIAQALALLEAKIDVKRQELVLARQSEETLNTLKTKEQTRWTAERLRAENSQQDDTYISQAFRRTINGSSHV